MKTFNLKIRKALFLASVLLSCAWASAQDSGLLNRLTFGSDYTMATDRPTGGSDYRLDSYNIRVGYDLSGGFSVFVPVSATTGKYGADGAGRRYDDNATIGAGLAYMQPIGRRLAALEFSVSMSSTILKSEMPFAVGKAMVTLTMNKISSPTIGLGCLYLLPYDGSSAPKFLLGATFGFQIRY